MTNKPLADYVKLPELEEYKAADGVQVKYYACDAGNEEEVIAARDFAVSEEGIGGCDILVNAQGINKKMFSWEIDTEYWKAMTLQRS